MSTSQQLLLNVFFPTEEPSLRLTNDFVAQFYERTRERRAGLDAERVPMVPRAVPTLLFEPPSHVHGQAIAWCQSTSPLHEEGREAESGGGDRNHHVSTSITQPPYVAAARKRMMSERCAIFIFFSRMSSFRVSSERSSDASQSTTPSGTFLTGS